jgi:NAD(P)-dependent dehydrogenase (short-subunit alcohol dehydrogenase family)
MSIDAVRLPGFKGRNAVVTGGARGIGRRIVMALRTQGARVAALDVAFPDDGDWDQETMRIVCDVTSEASVDNAFSGVEAQWGTITILVNNAGILVESPVHETSLEDWERTMGVNATGTFLCSRRAIPRMRAEGYGRILSIGSSAGKTGGARNVGAYGASKAALMALAKAIASENAAFGITSNALAPALIATDMIAGGLDDLASLIPVGRIGSVDDIAYATLMLTSEAASYITAEVTDVNGGFLVD